MDVTNELRELEMFFEEEDKGTCLCRSLSLSLSVCVCVCVKATSPYIACGCCVICSWSQHRGALRDRSTCGQHRTPVRSLSHILCHWDGRVLGTACAWCERVMPDNDPCEFL